MSSGITSTSKKIKSVLHDITITVMGKKQNESEEGFLVSEEVPILLSILALELNYGPCIDLTIRVDKPCEMEWFWDDHPFLHCRARKERDREEPVAECGEILDDTPAVRAMLAELCEPVERKLYGGTDCGHRARLIAALEMFWS